MLMKISPFSLNTNSCASAFAYIASENQAFTMIYQYDFVDDHDNKYSLLKKLVVTQK